MSEPRDNPYTGITNYPTPGDNEERPVHTVRGIPIGPEGSPYGVTHDYDCPACQDTPFTLSPRSETYWSS